MASIIGGSPYVRTMRSAPDSSSRLDAEPSLDSDSQVEDMAAPDIQAQMAEVEDDAATLLAQFGRFRASERKGRRSEDFERILDTEAEEKIDDLMQMFKGPQGAKNEKSDLATLMREARQRFRDESDLMLALREMRRRKKLDGEPVDVVERAIEELLKEGDAKQMKGGINAALKAKVFGKRMQLDPARLRQLYRQFLEFEDSPLVIYEDWIEQFGARKRKRILEYVSAALTYDMQSLDPSCSCAAEFGPLLATVGNVRTLSSADQMFVGRMLDEALVHDCEIDEESALRILLGGLQRPFAVEEVLVETLGAAFSMLSPPARAQLMQLMLRGFSRVPIVLFGDADARHTLIATMQEMVGELYMRERRRAYRDATRRR